MRNCAIATLYETLKIVATYATHQVRNAFLQLFAYIAASSGMSDADFEKLRAICEAVPQLEYICLDVANGYSEHFVEFIRRVREAFPRHTIFAGNVVTGEMVEELILSGADVVKVRRCSSRCQLFFYLRYSIFILH